MMGLQIPKAPAGYRNRRFMAFLIDLAILLGLLYLSYTFAGAPDFFAVQNAMDLAKAAGNADPQFNNAVFSTFGTAWVLSLGIFFCYDVVAQLLLGGATVGKKLLGLRIVPQNPDRSPILQALLLVVRSALKVLTLYFMQGLPFLICQLTIFSNEEGRSGFDIFVKTKVIEVSKEARHADRYQRSAEIQ